MKWGLVLFVLLQVCDVLGTLILYELSGTSDMERNPIARQILATSGGAGLAGFKALGLMVIAGCWLQLPTNWRGAMLGFSNVMMASIVTWNTYLTVKIL